MTFKEFILKHHGERVCVIGGAPMTVSQAKRLRADVLISANDHGAKLRPVDYVVAMDDAHAKEGGSMRERIRQHTEAPIIGPYSHCDIQLATWPSSPHKLYSGLVAIWAAWAMGAHVILVAGMNGYDGEPGFLAKASQIAKIVKCEVRVVGGGPLTKFWPAYDAREKFGDYAPHSTLDGLQGLDGDVRIRVLRSTQISNIDRKAGEELSVMRREVADLLKHQVVEELGWA